MVKLKEVALDAAGSRVVAEEEDEDDEEYEADLGLAVTLGLLEKPQNPSFLLRHFFPSKAGGTPAWLDPVNLPSGKSCLCDFCGEPLQFLLQVYAPLPGMEFAFHRTLYVFMCSSMSCLLRDQHEQWKKGQGNTSRSVKVFRCQLPRSNPFYSSEPPKYDGTDRPTSDGAALCFWCGSWNGMKVCSGCKIARYCSEKHQVSHWRSGHKMDCSRLAISSESSQSGQCRSLETIEAVACNSLWPEFEIVNEEEGAFDLDAPDDENLKMSLAASSDDCDTFNSVSNYFEVDDEKKSFACFQERIGKCPEQVLRYCREPASKPLWPMASGRPSTVDISKCNYCRGSRCFEFQILPQLLYYFSVKNDPNSLDWATIVLYTCEASCEGSVGYKEELAWVQLSTPNL